MTLIRRCGRWCRSTAWLSKTGVEVELSEGKRRWENVVPESLEKREGIVLH